MKNFAFISIEEEDGRGFSISKGDVRGTQWNELFCIPDRSKAFRVAKLLAVEFSFEFVDWVNKSRKDWFERFKQRKAISTIMKS